MATKLQGISVTCYKINKGSHKDAKHNSRIGEMEVGSSEQCTKVLREKKSPSRLLV